MKLMNIFSISLLLAVSMCAPAMAGSIITVDFANPMHTFFGASALCIIFLAVIQACFTLPHYSWTLLSFILLWMLTMPAEAQQHEYEPWGGDFHSPQVWYEHVEPGQAHFGKLMYWNQTSSDDQDVYVIETPEGDVTVHIEHTQNIKCTPACPDTLTIYGLPDGVVALPSSITADEETFHSILLYKYLGG